jgi:hypothetical protein
MTALWTWLSAKHDHKWNSAYFTMNLVLFLPAFPAGLLFAVTHNRDTASSELLSVCSWLVLPVWAIYYQVILGIFAHLTRLSDRIDRLEEELAILSQTPTQRPNEPAVSN